MNRISLLIVIVLLVTACRKEDTPGKTTTTTSTTYCDCNDMIAVDIEFLNMKILPDTMDWLIYDTGTNFSNPKGCYYGFWIDSTDLINGVVEKEGMYFAEGYEYGIRLRQRDTIIKIKNVVFYNDTANCALLNDSIRCYDGFSYRLGDSMTHIPKMIEHYNKGPQKLRISL